MTEAKSLLRDCGHPWDAIWFFAYSDQRVEVFCIPCLLEKVGLKPCETLTVEEFLKRYGGKK